MRIFLFLAFIGQQFISYSQDASNCSYRIEFEGQFVDTVNIKIDTVNNFTNVWQIGELSKTVINSAYSLPNGIITDTLNPYPINDTSVFVITLPMANPGWTSAAYEVTISFFYKVNSDSLNDFGLIEFSPDQGVTWYNLVNHPSVDWWPAKPVLTGNVNWTETHASLTFLADSLSLDIGDTIQYKFTFISDGTFDGLDGLAYDNFLFTDCWLDINEKETKQIKVHPNPVSDLLFLKIEKNNSHPTTIYIYDISGKMVLEKNITQQEFLQIDCHELLPGTYLFNLTDLLGVVCGQGNFVKL